MANAKAILEILGEDKTAAAWNSALGKAKSSSDQMQSMFRGAFVGGAIAGAAVAVTRIGREMIALGDDLNKASVKSGIASQQFQSLAYAAKLADVDVGALSTGIKKMQVAMSEAASGSSSQRETFNALQISFESIRNLKPDEQFELIAEKISQLKDPADRARAATELFGKAGADLLPMFEKGAAGIRKAREEAKPLLLSDEQMKRLSDADEAIKRMNASFRGLGMTITSEVAPAIAKLANQLGSLTFRGAGSALAEWVPGFPFATRAIARATDPEFGASPTPFPKDFSKAGAAFAPGTFSPPGFQADANAKALADNARRIADQNRAAQEALKAAEKDRLKAAADELDRYADGLDRHNAQMRADSEYATAAERLKRLQIQQDLDATLRDWDKYVGEVKASFGDLSEYSREAMRGIQDSFKLFLMDPFHAGLKGMAVGILQTFQQIFAEIAAQKLAMALVGKMDDAGNLSGGALSGFINGIFGGFKAEGGPVTAGRAYVVGEKRPELFVPGVSGTIVPRIAGAGGVTVAPVYNIDARGATTDLVKQLPAILEASNQRAVAMARAQIRDDLSRGAFRR